MEKKSININFNQGLDTKTDPFQIAPGNFLSLTNTTFQTGKRITKRDGYGPLALAPPFTQYLTTLNGNLLAIGQTVNALDSFNDSFIENGTIQPCSVSVNPAIRNSLNQLHVDSISANGLTCIAYTTQGATNSYFYAIQDTATQQYIVVNQLIPVLGNGSVSGSSRIFIVGGFFVIVSQVLLVSGSTFLQYCAIPIDNPTMISVPQNIIAQSYVPITANPAWDGAVGWEGNLVIAFNTTVGGQSIHVAVLTATQIAARAVSTLVQVYNGFKASIMSVCVDPTPEPNASVYYISFWNSTNSNSYNLSLIASAGVITTITAPFLVSAAVEISNLASCAENGVLTLYNEINNNYGYDNTIPSHFITSNTIVNGAVTASQTIIRSVGLASKAFFIDSIPYFLSAFQSPYQNTYFLINGSNSSVVAKLAYQNGGGYLALGLPNITLSNNGQTVSIPYLFKQNVQSINTKNDTKQSTTGNIYSQLGINIGSITIGTQNIASVELAGTLNFTGGFLSMFDGTIPVEHNFFLFPDSVKSTWATTGGNIAAHPSGSSNDSVYFYQVCYEWTDARGNPYRSQPSIAIGVTTTGNGTSGSITLNIPTLRLTQKVGNIPVKIVIYRWSLFTQVYNQVTSIVLPLLNDITVDSVTFVDTLADSDVIGNNLIYTTGGVVPDTNGPASNIMCAFDTRLLIVDAETPDVLWLSKTVVAGEPVEMSSLFTIFVSPNIATFNPSGPITALAPMDDKAIIFKANAIFYINGIGPDNLGTTSQGSPLGNYSQPIFITSVVGCANEKSIALVPDGLIFQSNKGIWLLNRSLGISYIGAPVERFNLDTVTSAQVIPESNYVLFTLNSGTILMYDYYYQQWGEWVGTNPVISSCIYNGRHTILNRLGNILQQTPGIYVDSDQPVLIGLTSAWLNLAGLQGYERFYEFVLLATYLSPHFLQVGIAYDYNPSILHSSTIDPNPSNFNAAIAGPFGIPTPFGAPLNLEEYRIHSKKQLCSSFQITIQEVFAPAYAIEPGAGFTLSGLTCLVGLKKAIRPFRGTNAVG